MLTFPEEKGKHNTRAIYLPAVIVGAVPALFLLLQPDATSGVNLFFRLLFGLFLLGYLGLAIIGLIPITFSMAALRSAENAVPEMAYATGAAPPRDGFNVPAPGPADPAEPDPPSTG